MSEAAVLASSLHVSLNSEVNQTPAVSSYHYRIENTFKFTVCDELLYKKRLHVRGVTC